MLLYAFKQCKANHNKVWLTDLEAKFDDKLNICYLIMERWINKGIIHGGASESDLYYYFDERFIVMNAVQFMDYLRKRGYYE